MSVFEERGKPEYPKKNLSEQGREPTTNSTHKWRRVGESKTGHIGERRAFSPLCHRVRQNRCELMIKTFFWVYSLKFEDFVFFKMHDESEHSENKFCYPGELSDAEILASCQLTTKAQNETQRSSQMKEFTTFSVANIEQTSGQEKNFSRWPVRYLPFGISK